jgi:DNA polymerase I-like protein with 3'-5' exonuclease and polymerase domains
MPAIGPKSPGFASGTVDDGRMARFLGRGTAVAGLFDTQALGDANAAAPPWSPEPFPDLADDFELDFETTGLRWWDGDLPIGCAVTKPDGSTQYLSWGHRIDGPRHDERQAKRWLAEQARGRLLTNAGVKFDVHMAMAWGVDLEAAGCRVDDVQHHAALLDDHRRKFSLEVLCEEFLSDERKILSVNGIRLDPARMADYRPGLVAVRAEADVRQTRKLKELFRPRLAAEGLLKVLVLESECVWATAEMERNAAFVDVEKLRRWATGARREYEACLMKVASMAGFMFNPDRGDDWARLFRQRGVTPSEFTKSGKASFTAAVVDGALRASGDEAIKFGRRAGKLADLLSKYLDKYAATVGDDGKLRFSLHQLRSDEGGTVTGRFSSSAIQDGVGANIQQILALEKQLEAYGPDYVVRELFVAERPNEKIISADAEQIEYRLFAHYANNPKVLEAYAADPRLSFHKLVWGYLQAHKPDLGYKALKNLNFMQIYGGGIVKLALMMGYVTQSEADELNRIGDYGERARDPRLAKAMEVKKVYDRELPEVGPLLKRAADFAERRGFVRDFLGRRSRFPDGQRLHKALNGVIQGGAGTILKTKMVEAHKAANAIGFTPRMSIHDQIIGDGTTEAAGLLAGLLDRQSYPEFRVPILWSVKAEDNWRLCDEKDAKDVPPRGFNDPTRDGR